MRLRLIYEGKLPGLNEMTGAGRRNRFAEAKMRRDVERDLIRAWTGRLPKRPFAKKVYATVLFYEPDNRRDEDNVKAGEKYIFDALKKAGVLADDGRRHLHIVHDEVFTDKARPRIEITLTEDRP